MAQAFQLPPLGSRVVEVHLASTDDTSSSSIRSLKLDGQIPTGHNQLSFEGIATGITSHPRRYGHPTVVKIQTSGRAKLDIRGVLDRTRDVPLDRFVVTCPNIAQSDWTLGDSDKLAVVVPEGSMRLDANLRIKGERLTGDVLLRRVAGAMKPVGPSKRSVPEATRSSLLVSSRCTVLARPICRGRRAGRVSMTHSVSVSRAKSR